MQIADAESLFGFINEGEAIELNNDDNLLLRVFFLFDFLG